MILVDSVQNKANGQYFHWQCKYANFTLDIGRSGSMKGMYVDMYRKVSDNVQKLQRQYRNLKLHASE
ncbi:hypothetical protein BPOR_1055g00030 [Botrytis porri]|uniref:Uncharacterized protein n=1 Tax=Botrytis porri TaxID=87229 RepID=A0A4Z1KBX1_9HELO|nr:hypothetical protein BPOR_1055g00030 [Botrytis porri]